MVSPVDMANALAEALEDQGRACPSLQLQKLMLAVQVVSFQKLGRPAFDGRFRVTRFGPVIDKVSHRFEAYGGYPVAAPAGSLDAIDPVAAELARGAARSLGDASPATLMALYARVLGHAGLSVGDYGQLVPNHAIKAVAEDLARSMPS